MTERTVLRLSFDEERDAVRICVREEDFDGARRRTYTVPREEYERLGSPSAGDTLDEEMVAALAEAEGRMKATEKAVSLLSYGDNSCRALCRKLRTKGYDRETAEAAVARMLAFLEEQGCVLDISETRPHHEIYLSDPRKTAPEKRKTVIRLPIRRL